MEDQPQTILLALVGATCSGKTTMAGVIKRWFPFVHVHDLRAEPWDESLEEFVSAGGFIWVLSRGTNLDREWLARHQVQLEKAGGYWLVERRWAPPDEMHDKARGAAFEQYLVDVIAETLSASLRARAH